MTAARSSVRVLLCVLGWPLSAAQAQTAAGVTAPRAYMWPVINVRFRAAKPVLGLPRGNSHGQISCSPEGEMFFSLSGEPDAAAASGSGRTLPVLYRLKDSGEVQVIARLPPPTEFTDVSVRDFFAAEHDVVTLLRAEVRSDGDPNIPAQETRYFASVSDHDGDGGRLVPLDVRFRPSKIALFGSGDFLVLGWDGINLMPVLALVKDDGTVRKFFDLGNVNLSQRQESQKPATATSLRELQGAPAARTAEELLARAAFSSFGSEVLLTFPGTAKALQVWSPGGDSRNIPIALPAGFVLHDVVQSGRHWTLVVRAQAEEDSAKEKKPSDTKPQQRLFEMNSTNGGLIREFVTDKPTVQDVTCAVNPRLTAVYFDTLDEAVSTGAPQNAAGDGSAAQPKPTHLVVATSLK